jgi:hypothetical protein
VLLQKRGQAAFAILTTPFGDQVDRVMTYQSADRDLPALVLDHPMQNIDAAGLEQRAVQLADIAVSMLDGTWR